MQDVTDKKQSGGKPKAPPSAQAAKDPQHPAESTLKVKMTKSQEGGTSSAVAETRQSFNQKDAGQKVVTQPTGPNAMGPPAQGSAAGEVTKKPKRKTIVQKTVKNRSVSEQRQASGESRTGDSKDASAKSAAKPAGSGGATKQPTLKKRSSSQQPQASSKQAVSASSPPKLHSSNPLVESMQEGGKTDAKSAGNSANASGTKKTTTLVTRKIKVASSTKKKLGSSSGDKPGKEKKTRTTIIKKVIRKKKGQKTSSVSAAGSEGGLKVVKTTSKVVSSSTSIKEKLLKKKSSTSDKAHSIKSATALKLKSQRSAESAGKPPRPPVLLAEDEEQYRWILKPFATAEDQKVWRERFFNLLAKREQAQSDPEKKEPPCMACYTRVPNLAKTVMAANEELEIIPTNRLTPTEASWLTMPAYCKRCCNNKQQLTGAHLSCLGLRSRGFQLLDLRPAPASYERTEAESLGGQSKGVSRKQKQTPEPAQMKVAEQILEHGPKRILIFECDLCAYSRQKKGVSGGDSAVKKFATCLVCRRRNWSSQDNPGGLMKKVTILDPEADPSVAQQPVGVHAICAALMGKQKSITLLDARQMLYATQVLALEQATEVQNQVEERKEQLSKCDICKVTIKRAAVTVNCQGHDTVEKPQEDQEMADNQGDQDVQMEEDKAKEAVACTKQVHSSCMMERSKWKTLIFGKQVKGYCRGHEQQYRDASTAKNVALRKLIKLENETMLMKQSADGQAMEQAVSVDGSRFKMSVADFQLFKESTQIKDGEDDGKEVIATSAFEQYLLLKLWFCQANQALRSPASEQLIHAQVQQAQTHLIFDPTDCIKQLTDKLHSEVNPPSEQVIELLQRVQPLEIYIESETSEIVVDKGRLEANEATQMQINACLNESLQSTSLLRGHLLDLYLRRNEHFALSQGQAMLQAPEKSLLFEEVGKILQFMEELKLKDFMVYKKLSALQAEQQSWRLKIKELVSKPQTSLDTLKEEMRSYRNRERGVALSQTRLAEFKRIFGQKTPIEHLITLMNEDVTQQVFDNSRYIVQLRQKFLWVTEFDNLPQTVQQLQCQVKPLQQLYETLLLLACQPLRPSSIEGLMGIWQHSCLWQAHAKSFIAMHVTTTVDPNNGQATLSRGQNSSAVETHMDWESSQEPVDKDEAIEYDRRLLSDLKDLQERFDDFPRVTSQLSRHLAEMQSMMVDSHDGLDEDEKPAKPESAPTRMLFTDSDVNDLLSLPCMDNFNTLRIYDKSLYESAWNRAAFLRKLKEKLEHVAEECHQIDDINAYIKTCKAQTNFDLSHQAQVAKEKLCLMQDALKIGQINNQQDQGLVASEVYSRVQELKERETDKIRIPADLEMMLQAKVQISEKLRRDFYDILEKGRGADSFNKEQMQNLRNIVQKATKDHGLQMEQENKIVDNLRNSEAWLDQTFRSLKKDCGSALNQIDFKDFQQLHSIFPSAKDCELLLKRHISSKSQMDNLVGAAKNLYMSLLRTKWLFDVQNLMDKATGTKDLAQLLCLYTRACELEIDFNKTSSYQDECVVTDDPQGVQEHQRTQGMILKEFSRLGQVSKEFDSLFGTHQKIIQTLEKHEKEHSMDELEQTVQRLNSDLQISPAHTNAVQTAAAQLENPVIKREFSSRIFAISTANELEILKKVRDYIRLNENYNEFMLGNEKSVKSDAQPDDDQLKNETEVQEPAQQSEKQPVEQEETKKEISKSDQDEKQSEEPENKKKKISYQKAMELQRQAREQQIPDDIPVLRRLNQSVQRFEKFRRLCTDYYRFRDKIKMKGAELLTSNSALIGQKHLDRPKLLIQASSSIQQANSDTKFSLVFLKRLLLESDEIEIEIPKEYFNKEKIIEEMTHFQQWKIKTEQTLKLLEKELSHSSGVKPENWTDVIAPGTRKLFEEAKQKIRDLPVFDNDTFMRIQAFEWLLMATSLIQGQHTKTNDGQGTSSPDKGKVGMQSQRIYSLTFWEQLFRQHENYLKVLPMLEDHPIIQNILWEMDRARHIVDFVKATKKTVQSNQGKFLSDRYYNYVAFKDKQEPAKIRKLLDQALSTRVDINEETQALKEWLRAYERYMQMDDDGTLYTGNSFEKIKQIYRNIYLSPLDFGDLYFEIGKRLEIANQIRQDIKFVIEENQIENKQCVSDMKKRISLSRIETDLKHFKMNCQIPGIYEIEKVMQQIKSSKKTIQECHDLLTDESKFPEDDPQKQIESLEKARKIQSLIEIDMEDEELEILKLMFTKNVNLILGEHAKIDVDQFKALQRDFKQVLKNKLDSDIASQFSEFMHQVNMCLKLLSKCPTKELLDNEVKDKIEELCPQVKFEQLFIDRAAQLYHQSQKGGDNAFACLSEESGSSGEEGEAEMSEQCEESSSQGSRVSRSGRDSRDVSSDSESSSSSDGSSSSSSESSSEQDEEAEEESKAKGEASHSSGDQVKSPRKLKKPKVAKEKEGSGKEDSKNGSGDDEEDASGSSSEAIATRKSKRSLKTNKMDDHIYFSKVGQTRTSEEAGLKKDGKNSGSKRQKTGSDEHNSSESEERVFSDAEPVETGKKDKEMTREERQRHQERQMKKRQLKKERKEAKQAEKTFMRQKQRQEEIREKRKMETASPMDSDLAFSIQQDHELQQRLKQTQDRIRNKSRTQIYDLLAKFNKKMLIGSSSKDSSENKAEDTEEERELQHKLHIKAVMQQLETTVFDRHNQVSVQYQSKISDILTNLNLLQSSKYHDLAELFFVRKTFNIARLQSSCISFSEFIEKIYQQRQERRQRQMALRAKEAGKKQPDGSHLINTGADPMKDQNTEVSVPAHQKLLNLSYPSKQDRSKPDLSKHAFTKEEITVPSETPEKSGANVASSPEEQKGERITMTRHDSLASIDSLESNPAKFSDDEEDAFKQAASGLTRNKANQGPRRERPLSHGVSGASYVMPVPSIIQIQQFKYNPYSIVQASKQTKMSGSLFGMSSFGMPSVPVGPSKQEQILYNPIKSATGDGKPGQSSIKIRNAAAPGSLLKVWEGTLDIGGSSPSQGPSTFGGQEAQTIESQLFSVGDIRQYQALPEFPDKLVLKGKSKIGEVTAHFRKLRQEMLNQKQNGTHSNNVLLKGWVTRKNLGSQDNSDRYTMHYDQLEQAQRCSVFTLFEGVSIYLIPITSQTKDFCRQMGIYPLKGKEHPSSLGNNNPNPEEHSILEETHYYAFLSQIRQTFSKRSSYQNPEVICHAHEMPKRHVPRPPQPEPVSQQPLKSEHQKGFSPEHASRAMAQTVAGPISDPRFADKMMIGAPAQKESPTVINLIQAAQPNVIKNEFGYASLPANPRSADGNVEMVVIDEDEARIDALIEKFRAQSDPNIDEIQRELPPLLNSKDSGRKEEKLVAFLKEIIAKVQSKQQVPAKPEVNEPSQSIMMQQSYPPTNMRPPQGNYQGGMMAAQRPQAFEPGLPPQPQNAPQHYEMASMPPYGGDNGSNMMHHPQQRFDQGQPPYGMAGEPYQQRHPSMMQGRMGPHGQQQQQSHMPPQSMDNPMVGPPPMVMHPGMGGSGPPYMRMPPTQFPQQNQQADFNGQGMQPQLPYQGQQPPYPNNGQQSRPGQGQNR